MSSKSPALSFTVTGSGDELAEAVVAMASTRGTHTLTLTPEGATLKALTDRIRRIPRQRGLNALLVKVTPGEDGTHVLAVTNTGKKATPWPKRETEAKPAAKKPAASKAKAPAKPAAKKPAASKAKAPAKRTRKSAADAVEREIAAALAGDVSAS